MIDRLYVRCIEALIIFGVIVMVTLTFASTVLRFVPGVGGIYWAEELTRYSNVWVVFLAGGLGVRYGIHLGVDVVAARVPIPVRKILTVVSCLLMIAFEIVLIYFGTIVTISNMQQQSASLEVPMGLFYAAIPVGGVLLLLETVLSLIRTVRGDAERRPGSEEFTL